MTYWIEDSRVCFDRAIAVGILDGERVRAANYAGDFMYMHSDRRGDHFKHCDTRRYVLSPRVPS